VEAPTAFAAGAATVLPAAVNADYSATGFVGGGQIGCNYQMGSFVLGGEADAQYTSFRGSRGAVSLGNTNGGPATIVPGIIAESFESNWWQPFRGRAGFTTGPILFYVTGGAAWANSSSRIRFASRPPQFRPAPPVPTTIPVSAGRWWRPRVDVRSELVGQGRIPVRRSRDGFIRPVWGRRLRPSPIRSRTRSSRTNHHASLENIARLGLNYKFLSGRPKKEKAPDNGPGLFLCTR
jgi:hypothetical protein